MGVDDKYIIIFQKSFKYYIYIYIYILLSKDISMKLISVFKSKLLCCSTSSLVFF